MLFSSKKVNCFLSSIIRNVVSRSRGMILTPLFGTCEGASEVLYLALGSSFQERYKHTKVNQVEGDQDGQGAGTHDGCGQAEDTRGFLP